jgi:seryl-tRNA synthetase
VIDLRLLREQPDVVRSSQAKRGEDPSVVDRAVEAERARREAATAFDGLRNEQRTIGKDIAKAKGDEKTALLAHASELAAQVKVAEAAMNAAEADLRSLHLSLANIVEDGVPAGGENDFVVVEHVGTPGTYDFPGTTSSSVSCSARSTPSAARR